jgi:hypothetical protein
MSFPGCTLLNPSADQLSDLPDVRVNAQLRCWHGNLLAVCLGQRRYLAFSTPVTANSNRPGSPAPQDM